MHKQRQHTQIFQGHRVETRYGQMMACMMMMMLEMQEVGSKSESEGQKGYKVVTLAGSQETRR